MKKLFLILLIVFGFLQISGAVVMGDTILQMHFDNSLQDSSGNGFNGQWNGNSSYAPGYRGSAIDLSTATNNYVIVEHQDPLAGMAKLYVSVWAKKNNADIGGDLVRKHSHYVLKMGKNYISGFVVNDSGEWVQVQKYNFETIHNTDWHHYELTYDGEIVRLIVDSEEVSARPLSGNVNFQASRDVYVGKNPWGDAFEGQIDELEIKDHIPAQNESADALLHMHFDDNVLDFSGNGLNGTWVGVEDYETGKEGQALNLTSVADNYVMVNHNDLLGGMPQLQISVWAKKNDADIGGEILRKHSHYSISIGADNVRAFLVNSDNEIAWVNKYHYPGVNDTNWHHYQLLYSNDIVRLVMDGEELAGAFLSGPVNLASNRDLYIGKNPWADAFSGQIDELVMTTNVPDTFILTLECENGSIIADPQKSVYSYNEQVSLTAIPDIGYYFAGWQGNAQGTENPVTIVMNADKTITADCSSASGGTSYYIDFENGDDTNNGLSPETPWKHAPGDANATLAPAAVELNPGNKIIFKGGVSYYGSINMPASGTDELSIEYTGNQWGDDPAVLDGSCSLSGWTQCESAADAGGNPNWQYIYYADIPADIAGRITPLTANLHENDQMCAVAQSPNPVDPFFYDDIESFYEIACENVSSSALTDADRLTQLNPDVFKDAYILLWVSHNIVDFKKILSFSPTDHLITYQQTQNPPYTDRPEKYALYNSVSFIDLPGEYMVEDQIREDGTKRIFLMPSGDIHSSRIDISVKPFGIDINNKSNITVSGFKVQKYAGQGIVDGVGIGTWHRSLPVSNINIKDNIVIQNRHATRGYGGIFLSNASDCNIENNIVRENARSCGIFINDASNCIIKDNTVCRPGQTGIRLYGSHDCQVINNTVAGVNGSHANTITVYLYSDNILIAGNRISESRGTLTLENSSNIFIYNNLLDASGTDNAINEWGGSLGGTIAVLHNTIVNCPKNASLMMGSGDADYVIKNNIIEGFCPSEGNDLSHNLYTGLMWCQNERYGWFLEEGGIVEENIYTVFTDPDSGDYTLNVQNDSPAIDAGTEIDEHLPRQLFPDYNFDTDINGLPRVNGSAPDIGAFEM